MSDVTAYNTAISQLGDKLQELAAMTEANVFLVSQLKEHEDKLKSLSELQARTMLRNAARAQFLGEGAETPNPRVMEILEESLGTGASAVVIPFPGDRGAKEG